MFKRIFDLFRSPKEPLEPAVDLTKKDALRHWKYMELSDIQVIVVCLSNMIQISGDLATAEALRERFNIPE